MSSEGSTDFEDLKQLNAKENEEVTVVSSESPANLLTPVSQVMSEQYISGDISNFFNFEEEIRIVSDPEGYHVAQLANQYRGTPVPQNKIIVLGDLMDYTIGLGDSYELFATSTLNKNKSQNPKTIRDVKSFCFKSIKYCNENPDKIKVMFGNRDLNKLKLLALGLIKDTDTQHFVRWWDEGDTYLDSARILLEKINNGSAKWAIESMKNWKPFWRKHADTSHWKSDDPRLAYFKTKNNDKISCLERFYLIFGVDPSEGTMSAPNILFGVAEECGNYKEIFEQYQEILNQGNNNYIANHNNDGLTEAGELAAALVFTVFMDSLYGNSQNKNKKFTSSLRNFFLNNNSYYCAYAEIKDDLLLFSHGGMRPEFFQNCDIPNIINGLNSSTLKDMIQQTGGYTTNTKQTLNSALIKEKINAYNSKMKNSLNALFSQYTSMLNSNQSYDKPTAQLLFHLVVSVPHSADENSCYHKHASPIMPGLDNLITFDDSYRAKPICIKDKNLLQFVGHMPVLGFAPTIDKYIPGEGNSFKSYGINLDISNSILSQFLSRTNICLAPSFIDKNYSYLSVIKTKQSNNIKLLSNVNLALSNNNNKNIIIDNCDLLGLTFENLEKDTNILNFKQKLVDEVEPRIRAQEEKIKSSMPDYTAKSEEELIKLINNEKQKIENARLNIHGIDRNGNIVASYVINFKVHLVETKHKIQSTLSSQKAIFSKEKPLTWSEEIQKKKREQEEKLKTRFNQLDEQSSMGGGKSLRRRKSTALKKKSAKSPRKFVIRKKTVVLKKKQSTRKTHRRN